MRVLDHEQGWPMFRRLLQREHANHCEQLVVGSEIGLVAKLLQRGFEQSCVVEPGAVDYRAFLVVVMRLDKMPDKCGFAG